MPNVEKFGQFGEYTYHCLSAYFKRPISIIMPKPTIPPPPPEATAVREPKEQSVNLSLSIPRSVFDRLTKMRKAKGAQYEQELIRVMVTEGLDRAGF